MRAGCVPVIRPKPEEFVAKVAFVPLAVTESAPFGEVKFV